MKDNTVDVETVEETPKVPLAQRLVSAAKSRTGKTVLAVTGTVGALAATYVFGYRQGESRTVEILAGEAIAEAEEELEELSERIDPALSEDSPEE